MARSVPSPFWILAVWFFGALLSFFGALIFAELGAMMPETGGHYVFLREAFGPLPAFLLGWTYFFIVQAAAIAYLSVSFGIYLGYFVTLPPLAGRALSIAVIAVLTYANCRGVRAGANVQNAFTVAKLVGIAILVAAALVSPARKSIDWGWDTAGITAASFGVAMIACLSSYEGWSYVSFVAGEVRDPLRNVVRSLAIGLAACCGIYLVANYSYLAVLTVPEIIASPRAGALAAERALGGAGGAVLTLTVLFSILGAINGLLLAPSRIYVAQARNGLLFKKFGELHPKHGTPVWAVGGAGVWAALLAMTGAWEALIDFAVFSAWIFYFAIGLALIWLRVKQPDRARPYRMWGYPVTPALFVLVALAFLVNTVVEKPVPALTALGIIGLGIPVFLLGRRTLR